MSETITNPKCADCQTVELIYDSAKDQWECPKCRSWHKFITDNTHRIESLQQQLASTQQKLVESSAMVEKLKANWVNARKGMDLEGLALCDMMIELASEPPDKALEEHVSFAVHQATMQLKQQLAEAEVKESPSNLSAPTSMSRRKEIMEALEGMFELCGNYFDESQLVCERDKTIWKQGLEALAKLKELRGEK